MNTRWLCIFRKLFVTSFKEFVRDFLPPLFTMAMPTGFMVMFGLVFKCMGKEGSAAGFVGPMSEAQYCLFIMLGLLSLGLIGLSLQGTTMPLVQAREKGVLRQYMLIPLPLSALLAAQVSVRLVIALAQGSLLLLTAKFAFGVAIVGSVFELLPLYMACATVMITCGYALAGLLHSESIANILVIVFGLYMVGVGQIFMDLRGIPYAKWLVYTTPAAPVSDLLRQICLGPQWSERSVGASLAVLSGWALAGGVLGIRKFRFLPQY